MKNEATDKLMGIIRKYVKNEISGYQIVLEIEDILLNMLTQRDAEVVKEIEGAKLVAKTARQFMNRCPFNEGLDKALEIINKNEKV